MLRLTGMTAFALFACGCGQELQTDRAEGLIGRGDPVPATTRIDNGVTVYEYPPDAFDRAPRWTLDSEPVSTIGGADGDPKYDLTRTDWVIPLSDGRVMTFAGVGNQVFVFGRDGKGERVIGQTGQGPGDWMRFGTPVLLEDDTVLVLDFANRRLNWVTADGGIVRTAPYEVTGDMRRMSRIAGFMSSGELLMHSAGSWGSHQTDSLNRSLASFVVADVGMRTISEASDLPGETGHVRLVGSVPDMQGVQFETRFRGRPFTDWRPLRLGGWSLFTAWDSVYASSLASSREIELRDATGTLGARIDVPIPRRAITNEIREAQRAIEPARLNAPGSERMVDRAESMRLAREAPFADSLPYFAELMTGSDGTLWAIDAIAPSDTGWTATAFAKDGSILGRLTVQERSMPMSFGANQVIVRTANEDGVTMLKVYRFTPS